MAHKKYRITIEALDEWEEDKNLLVSKVPTTIIQKKMCGGITNEEVQFEEQYEIKKVTKEEWKEIYAQEVPTGIFSLSDVIKAVNGIK